MRKPFIVKPDIVPDSDQDEFLEMKFDSGVKDFFFTNILYRNSGQEQIYHYPRIEKLALTTFLPFAST